MPTYEYVCEKCDHRFEVFHSMTAESLKKCPECGGKVKRLIGAGAAVIFKGSGFHATDYRDSRLPCGKDEPCSADSPCAKKH
jgi:putative FmdB family regulatory protein